MNATARTRPARAGAVLTVMCVGMFLVQLDVTVVNVALPRIGDGLHTGLAGLQWVVDAYTVVLAAFLLAGGAVGDRFGHRVVVLVGLAIFGVASLACATAPTLGVLVAARAVQGLGAAILLPGTLAVVTRTFSGRAEQARALGIWTGVSATALPAGPVLGGILVSAAGWRTIFWINIPIAAVALLVARRLVPGSPPAANRLDTPGVVLAAVSLGALVFAVIDTNSGASRITVVAAVIFVLATAGFLTRERRAERPVLPLDLFRHRPFVGANMVAAAMNLVGIGVVFVLTLYIQQVRHHDVLRAGLMMLPLFIPLSIMAPVTGRIAARTGTRPLMMTGLALGVLGGLGLLLVTSSSRYLLLLPTMLGIGIGMGLLTPSVVTAAMRSCPPHRQGLASGVNNTARQAAGAVGVAVFGVLVADPAKPDTFVAGLRVIAVLIAVLWGAAMIVTAYSVPRLTRAKEGDTK